MRGTWRSNIVVLSVLAAVNSLMLPNGHALDLQAILHSKTFLALSRQDSDAIRKRNQRYVKGDGTNLSRLFMTKGLGPNYIFEWLVSNGIPGWTMHKSHFKRDRQYAMASREYRSREDSGILVTTTVYVPAPEYRTSAEFDLIIPMSRLVPPKLRVAQTEEVSINGIPALIYTREEGGCSMVVDLPMHTLVNFETKNCSHIASVVELASKLDFATLVKNLQS